MNDIKEMILNAGLEYLGIDFAALAGLTVWKIIVVIYCLCLAFLSIQRIRRKCWMDYSIAEFGAINLYVPLSICLPYLYLWLMEHITFQKSSVKVIVFVVLIVVLIALLHEPLAFLIDMIRSFRLCGLLYWIALSGCGLSAILLLVMGLWILSIVLLVFFLILCIFVTKNWQPDSEDDYRR